MCRKAPFRSSRLAILTAALFLGLACVGAVFAQNGSQPPTTAAPTGRDPDSPSGSVKLRIIVTNPKGDPVANASVYVRYYTGGSGLMHHDQLQELDFKTNQDGSVKVPPVPQGKIQVQVIAQGWHTFGEWYEIEKDEQAVNIQLKEAPHWY